eukprot:jgi/Botrbrau1/78/Bobra.0022s0068.1
MSTFRALSTSLRTVWHGYEGALKNQPVLTQMVTSAGLWALGDVIAQRVEGSKGVNWRRTVSSSAYGAVVIGPVGHLWYSKLDRLVRSRYQPGTLAFVGLKVVADEVLFGPIHVAGFFAWMVKANNGTWQDVWEKVRRDFWSSYAAELAFWPAFQTLNFWKIPVRHQLLAVNSACLLDATFLCWVQNQEDWTSVLHWPVHGCHKTQDKSPLPAGAEACAVPSDT